MQIKKTDFIILPKKNSNYLYENRFIIESRYVVVSANRKDKELKDKLIKEAYRNIIMIKDIKRWINNIVMYWYLLEETVFIIKKLNI